MFGNVFDTWNRKSMNSLIAVRPNTSNDRKQRIEIEGTANFSYLYPSAIVASAKVQLDLKSLVTGSEKYEPFSYCKIKNIASENIKVYINQNLDNVVIVLAGTIETIKLDGLRCLTIENISATDTSANELIFEYGIDRAGADKYAQQQMARGR